MPIAITEWGPNTICTGCAFPMSTATAAPAGSQIAGLFAAESYALFMEQGAMAAHWLELHNNGYLGGHRRHERSVHDGAGHAALGLPRRADRALPGGRRRQDGSGDAVGDVRRGD